MQLYPCKDINKSYIQLNYEHQHTSFSHIVQLAKRILVTFTKMYNSLNFYIFLLHYPARDRKEVSYNSLLHNTGSYMPCSQAWVSYHIYSYLAIATHMQTHTQRTHTHTHTHNAHTHTYMHIHMHTHTCTHTHAYTHTNTHTHTHIQTHTHTYIKVITLLLSTGFDYTQ